MSVRDCFQPGSVDAESSAIECVITSHEKDLGGFTVRRVLPAAEHRRVGPFIFFDHMGPADFEAGKGMDVRPHPHIGLSTLTYLFEGQIMHRDSLGFVQNIEPGAVNWMTAGKGIVHSERTPDDLRSKGFRMHGLQIWIALPDGSEEVEPSFDHHPAGSLPVIHHKGTTMTLVAGEAFGHLSPVETYSPLFYLDVTSEAGADIPLPGEYPERAVYIVSGEISINGERFTGPRMIVLKQGTEPEIKACTQGRMMLLGGDSLASDRTVWWNFSSSSRERIEMAKADWKEGRFGQVPGETEFIPLPEN